MINRVANLHKMDKKQIIGLYNQIYNDNKRLREYERMHRREINELYNFIKSKGYNSSDVLDYISKNNIDINDKITKITKDNYKLLNDCIIELMGASYQTIILDTLKEMICIHPNGKDKFNKILKKHGVKITNTHGFKEYLVEQL